MKTMKEYAVDFEFKHINKGIVTKITDYSFTFTTKPKKENEQPKSIVYYLSYFYEA